MTDKELIDLAAKAAGMTDADRNIVINAMGRGEYVQQWNPLTDDGDALRLAVKLGICFGPNFDGDTAVAFGIEGRNICEPYDNDPYVATRRAIVRAAAYAGSRNTTGWCVK